MGITAGRRHGFADSSGQMTVEAAVALPVLLVVALVAVHSLTFVGQCASFDRQAREAVRVCATSPSAGAGPEQCAAQVSTLLQQSFGPEGSSVEVVADRPFPGYVRYRASIRFAPTLFGRPLADNVFGVRFPTLMHSVAMVVDPYRPGAII